MNDEQLAKAAETTRLLISDLQSMINVKSKGEDKIASRKSLEPTVRLRKDADELTEVKENDPEVQFIIDKLGDIFGG